MSDRPHPTPAEIEEFFNSLTSEDFKAVSQQERDAHPLMSRPPYRQWVGPDRTLRARLWETGVLEFYCRAHEDGVWGSPTEMVEEKA